MTHLAWEEAANGLQRRLEERCAADGHKWDELEGFGFVCSWCHAIEPEGPVSTPDWKARALAHATALRAILIVKAPPEGTAGASWLAESEETFQLAGITPGVGVGVRP